MKRNRLLTLLVLLMTAATGAWADETPLVTITFDSNGPVHSESGLVKLTGTNYTLDNVTFGYYWVPSGEDLLSATVEKEEGSNLNITKVVFYSLNNSGYIYPLEDNDAPFVCYSSNNTKKRSLTSDNWYSGTATSPRLAKIDVYGTIVPPTPKSLISATVGKQTKSMEQALPYATTIGELYEAVTGGSTSIFTMMGGITDITSTNTAVVEIGTLNGVSTPVTVKAAGTTTVALTVGNYSVSFNVVVVSPYYVALADDTDDATKWQGKVGTGEFGTLPIGGLEGGEKVTLKYNGRLKVKSLTATTDGWTGDLGNIPASFANEGKVTVPAGMTLTGTLTENYMIQIPDGATVTLAGVTINGVNDANCKWAGITCLGDATIILADNSVNSVKGFYKEYPGIFVPEGKKLIIQGGDTGSLTASPFDGGTTSSFAAGIGGTFHGSCGAIEIQGGTITATGGFHCAGIGSGMPLGTGNDANWGDITITGGTVTATGGNLAAGIGSGDQGGSHGGYGNITISGGTVTATGGTFSAGIGSGNCGVSGDITITDGVTIVTAKKGADAPNSIGVGKSEPGSPSTCGTITVGGTEYYDGTDYENGGDAYLTKAKIVYPEQPLDLSMLDNAGNDRTSMTTANCYMVHTAGKYKLPLVYGNAIKDGAANTAAYTGVSGTNTTATFPNHNGQAINAPWINKSTSGTGVDKGMGINVTKAELLWQDAQGLITAVGIDGDYLTLTVGKDADTQEGNALVAAKTQNGTIVWSWHIWVTKQTFADDDLTDINTGSYTYKVTPVNLGWVGGTTSTTGYCTYYQWGRKDAFIPSRGNESFDHDVYNIKNIEIQGNSSETEDRSIGQNIMWPTEHNMNIGPNTSGPCNTQYYNMWDAQQTGTTNNTATATVKTVYDPCPAGFCVPTSGLYYYIKGQTKPEEYAPGYTYSGVFFPASGFHIAGSGVPDSVGGQGRYWSATPESGGSGYCFCFTGTSWSQQFDQSRALGAPVRAVAE